MNYYSVDIQLEGDKFYPSKLMEKIKQPIKILAEFGAIAKKGRYKGDPSPYGLGLLEVTPKDNANNTRNLIEEYSNKLLAWKQDLIDCGVDEIVLSIGHFKESPKNILSLKSMFNLILMNVSVEYYTLEAEEEDVFEDKYDVQKNIQFPLNNDEFYQTLVLNLKKHPALNNPKILQFFICIYPKIISENLDEDLDKFEAFTNLCAV